MALVHWRYMAVLVLLAGCSRQPLPTLPDIVFPDVPDLPQQGPAFNPRFESDSLCAPVAVSNSLVWLEGNSAHPTQVEIVNILADHRYMATRPSIGTSPAGLIRGLEKYLLERGQGYARLEYAGHRAVPLAHRAAEPLSLQWLHAGLSPRSAVWLNLGWYTRVFPGVYRREGGHWVTLVGFRNGGLLVHDPGPWQTEPQPQPLEVAARYSSLMLDKSVRFAPLSLELRETPGPDKGRTALIDGAVLLMLAD